MTLLRCMRIEGDILLQIQDCFTHRYVSFLDISTTLGDIGAQSLAHAIIAEYTQDGLTVHFINLSHNQFRCILVSVLNFN